MADPFAGRVTYFKVISGVVKNDANLHERRTQRQRSAWPTSASLMGKTIQPVTNCTPAISARSPS